MLSLWVHNSYYRHGITSTQFFLLVRKSHCNFFETAIAIVWHSNKCPKQLGLITCGNPNELLWLVYWNVLIYNAKNLLHKQIFYVSSYFLCQNQKVNCFTHCVIISKLRFEMQNTGFMLNYKVSLFEYRPAHIFVCTAWYVIGLTIFKIGIVGLYLYLCWCLFVRNSFVSTL